MPRENYTYERLVVDMEGRHPTAEDIDLEDLQLLCHEQARAMGFWGEAAAENASGALEPWNFGEKIALAHSELSEALEADRKGLPSDHLHGVSGKAEELADCVIRCFDLAGALGVDLGEVILMKLSFNLTRGFKHGKKY